MEYAHICQERWRHDFSGFDHIQSYLLGPTWSVFDIFEAATSGSKMCARIVVPALAPSLLRRSQWHFADTYVCGSGVHCKISAQLFKAIFNRKKYHISYTFLQICFRYSYETWQGHCLGYGALCLGIWFLMCIRSYVKIYTIFESYWWIFAYV